VRIAADLQCMRTSVLQIGRKQTSCNAELLAGGSWFAQAATHPSVDRCWQVKEEGCCCGLIYFCCCLTHGSLPFYCCAGWSPL